MSVFLPDVADLLEMENRLLPRDGIGSVQGLPSITVQTGEWLYRS